jgi:hypothetical protein
MCAGKDLRQKLLAEFVPRTKRKVRGFFCSFPSFECTPGPETDPASERGNASRD